MQSKIVQLSNKEHKDVKISLSRDFAHVAHHHITPIIVQEIARVATDLPVAFIKNAESGDYMCVAVLGFKENENLLVKDGAWQGTFIPAGYTHYPLALVPFPGDSSKYVMTIDMASSAISDEGEPLFNEDATESDSLKKRRQALENYFQCALMTREFTKAVVELDLLEENSFSFEVGEDKRTISGIYVVSEEKLKALTDEQILELFKKGFLGAIYAHLMSMAQTSRLVGRIPR